VSEKHQFGSTFCQSKSERDMCDLVPHKGKNTTPTECEVLGLLPSQGGGHGKIRKGVNRVACIAKPYVEREDRFYRQIVNTPLSSIVPNYFGSSQSWLMLQDLTAGMASPCVADLKLGTRSFEVNASAEKAARQLANMSGTTTPTHGIRCIDICIRRDRQVVRHWDRRKGRQMDEAQLKKALGLFLHAKRRQTFRRLAGDLKAKLEQVRTTLPNLRLYSASVLVVYDGDKEGGAMAVKIIDFAHAYIDVHAEGGDPTDPAFDDNALTGLENLIALAQE
jgi:hypothetical protein